MNTVKEKISTILQAFAQEMYAQQGAEGGVDPSAQASDATGADAAKEAEAETVDADFEVVDDEDKK
jgi:hypothetical protein